VAPLTPKQLEVIMQATTCTMLGIDPATDTLAGSKVRIGWQVAGQPYAQDPSVDVCVLRAVEEDNLYDKLRDRQLIVNDDEIDISEEQYTRVWHIFWVLYGPNSFDHARMIRSGILNDSIHDNLATSNIYAVPEISAPIRVPEVSNGKWWERVDLECLFYENVLEDTVVNTVLSSEVILDTPAGVAADFTVTGE